MSETKPEKIPTAVLYQEIAAMMNSAKLSLLPPFGHKFYVVERENGIRHILQEKDIGSGVVCDVSKELVVSCLLSYIEKNLPGKKAYRFDADQANKCVRYWMATTPAIPIPLPIAELSDPRLCFSRLPFDARVDPNKTPLFSEFMSRCGNARALELFFGSLFFDWSDRQQYVYMYGEGQNGKSSIVRLFAKMFGSSYSSEDANTANNRFWTHGMVDKRLVVFPDTNNPTFPMSGVFKNLTGDDAIRVEPKGLPSYTVKLTAKFMFLSNHQLEVSSLDADLRRAIYIPVKPIEGKPSGSYEKRLWEEAPYIMGNCKAAFASYTNIDDNDPIEVEKDELILLAEQYESEYEHFFEKYFSKVSVSNIDTGMPSFYIQEKFKEEKIYNTRDQAKIISYICRKHHVARIRTTNGYVYRGIRPKTNAEIVGRAKETSVKIEPEEMLDSVNLDKLKVTHIGKRGDKDVWTIKELE